MENFTYNWNLSDLKDVKKNNISVFSCFSGAGGSSMGYKMSGCDVRGFCEVDEKMAKNYLENMSVEHPFIEPIQDLKNNSSLINKIKGIDILDGSPPCSSFSIAGNREKDWGKKRTFREGNYKQVLDNLFFDFIDLAAKVKPRVIIAENVRGILVGNAKRYANKIVREMNNLGYVTQVFLLDGSKMGLPQRRVRVFFIASKKGGINLSFNEKEIAVKDIDISPSECIGRKVGGEKLVRCWERTSAGKGLDQGSGGGCYNYIRTSRLRPLPTIIAKLNLWHWEKPNFLSEKLLSLASSFPQDYKYKHVSLQYACGMSVPPLMMHKVSREVIRQCL